MHRPFVLSGGGARGFAHLGIVKALNEHNIYPSAISGTSAGAVAGAFLANGFNPDEVSEILTGKLSLRLLSWNKFKKGLVSFQGIKNFLKNNLRYDTFEKLPIPLYITATSLYDGSQKIFGSGSIVDAIEASCAVPVVFPPVVIDGVPYVDGGLSNNLPVEPFLEHKSDIVSIYVNTIRDLSANTGIVEIMDRSFHLSFRSKVLQASANCFMYLEAPNLNNIGMFELHKAPQIVRLGYEFGKEYLRNRDDFKN